MKLTEILDLHQLHSDPSKLDKADAASKKYYYCTLKISEHGFAPQYEIAGVDYPRHPETLPTIFHRGRYPTFPTIHKFNQQQITDVVNQIVSTKNFQGGQQSPSHQEVYEFLEASRTSSWDHFAYYNGDNRNAAITCLREANNS